MTRTDAVSKSQRAHDWIREQITTGRYGPGHRLVLSTLAAELSMSAVPVREALRELTAEGLVTFERNVGARVAMIDVSQYRLTMQVISIAESAATALTAAHLTAEDLARARKLNDCMRDELSDLDPQRYSSLNAKFHHTLYRKCPNPRLVEIVESEWARLGHLRDSISTFVPGRAPISVCEHDALLGLIEIGASPEEIEHALRRHRTGTLTAFLSTRDAEQADLDSGSRGSPLTEGA